MKLFGVQKIDGGLAVALPSGKQILVALPDDRTRSALVLGERLLDVLDDPDEPHSKQAPPAGAPCEGEDGDLLDDGLAAIDAGIEAGRLVLRTLQLVSRRGR